MHRRGILRAAQPLHELRLAQRPGQRRQRGKMLVSASGRCQQQDHQIHRPFVDRGEVDRSPTRIEYPAAENDLAAKIAKPSASAPSLPAPDATSTSGVPKALSESALASVPSSSPEGATQLDKNEIAMLVTRGKDFLKDGDLASARLLFQRAAAAGNAEASFILGTTFDPLFIRRMGVVGMKPDIARAREWYKRAAELGSADATQQLATLQRGHWD